MLIVSLTVNFCSAKGYLNNEKATTQCLSKDGWFFSGDIGYYDDEHNFYIVDRIKELIKYKGYQVIGHFLFH